MRILIIEPYFTGSHAQWATGYQAVSRHDISILSLNGQHWKWRMHGGAVTLAQKYLKQKQMPDLILATDMLDLSTFLALTRNSTAGVPTALYFHENQLVYPWSPTDRDIEHKRDRHYGFINYSSALAADAVFFNSGYHRDAFLSALEPFLRHFPDHRGMDNIDRLAQHSSVLHLGLPLSRLDAWRPADDVSRGAPVILWNHRWEYDKNPEPFFEALLTLQQEGLDFKVAVLGENFQQQPAIFEEAAERLGTKMVQFGYAGSEQEYAQWLWRSDILPVTSQHDFFGVSVAEALYCGCRPLLPRRLSYPELLPGPEFRECFYEDEADFLPALRGMIRSHTDIYEEGRRAIARFDWRRMAACYDDALEEITMKNK